LQVILTFAKYQFILLHRLEEAEGGKQGKGIMVWRLYAVYSLSFAQVERPAVKEDFWLGSKPCPFVANIQANILTHQSQSILNHLGL